MSDGGAQHIAFGPYFDSSGALYTSIQVEHYAAGTTTNKTAWSDEAKTTTIAAPFIGDASGIARFFADGDYHFVIKDSSGVAIPNRDWDNVKVTSDTATLWEGNQGTSYPTVVPNNTWQLFAKRDGSGNFDELGINDGTAFRTLVKKTADDSAYIFDDIITKKPRVDVRAYLPSGFVTDGTVDYAAEIQAAFDAANAANGQLYLPAGTYLIETGLTTVVGGWQIIGDGRRNTVIKAGAAITMLSCVNTAGPKKGAIIIRDIQFHGNDLATRGLDLQDIHFTRFESLEIFRVDGNGLKMVDCEDFILSDLDVRRCGNWTNTLAGIDIDKIDGSGSNSQIYLGGTIENCNYHGMKLYRSSAIKLIGIKFHGQVPLNEVDTPNEIDLLYAEGCKRLTVIGCQFAIANRHAITIIGSVGVQSATIADCSFDKTQNYQGSQAGGTASITSGAAALTVTDVGTWAVDDAIRVTGAGSSGNDLYSWITAISGSTFTLNDNAGTTVSAVTIFTVNAAWNINASKGSLIANGNIFHKSDSSAGNHPSYMKEGGDIQLASTLALYTGHNSHPANPDTHVDRNGMAQYKMTTQIGNYHVWIDNSGKVRVKPSVPTSNTDGSEVGTTSATGIATLSDETAPRVDLSSNIVYTGGTTTITSFKKGYIGQVLTILANHTLKIEEGTSTLQKIKLVGGVDYSMNPSRTLQLVFNNGADQSETGSIDIAVSAITLTLSAAGSWTNFDLIRIAGAGENGTDLVTFIQSGAGTTSLTLNSGDPAQTTVSAAVIGAPYWFELMRSGTA